MWYILYNSLVTRFRILRFFLAVVLLIFTVIILVTITWPAPSEKNIFHLPFVIDEKYQLDGNRWLTWDYPLYARVDDTEMVKLTLDISEMNNISTTESSNSSKAVGRNQNVFDTYNVIAEARLDLEGMKISPQGSILESLTPGEKANFYWKLTPTDTGIVRGTLWFYVDLIPKKGGDLTQIPVIAKPIEIQVNSLMGIPVSFWRWLCALGILLSSVLIFPFLEERLMKFRRPSHKKNEI
jgi:hypothetical protein